MLALVVAYALLGCTWLIMKTEGALQRADARSGTAFGPRLLAVMAIVSLWTPLAHPAIADRWFSLPNLLWFMPVPALVMVTMYGLFSAVARNANYAPFLLTLVLIFLGYSGLGISLWPNIVPPTMSIWAAAVAAAKSGFHAGRYAVHHSVHPGLHVLELLRIPRQSHPRTRLSLAARAPGLSPAA